MGGGGGGGSEYGRVVEFCKHFLFKPTEVSASSNELRDIKCSSGAFGSKPHIFYFF